MFDPKLFNPTVEGPDQFIGCPSAAPGFVRTPDLQRQIWWLSKPDSLDRDYHVSSSLFRTSPTQS